MQRIVPVQVWKDVGSFLGKYQNLQNVRRQPLQTNEGFGKTSGSKFILVRSLNFYKEQRLHLDAILRRMVIKMLNLQRQKGEDETIFWKRLNSSATTAMEDSGIPSFQTTLFESLLEMGG